MKLRNQSCQLILGHYNILKLILRALRSLLISSLVETKFPTYRNFISPIRNFFPPYWNSFLPLLGQ